MIQFGSKFEDLFCFSEIGTENGRKKLRSFRCCKTADDDDDDDDDDVVSGKKMK